MKLAAAFIAAAMVLAGNGFAQTAAPTPSSSLAVTPIPPETQAEEANEARHWILQDLTREVAHWRFPGSGPAIPASLGADKRQFGAACWLSI